MCSVEFRTVSHLLCLDAHCAVVIPACAMGQGLDAPNSPCLSMPGLCAEEACGGRKGGSCSIHQRLLIGLAGLSIPYGIILPCAAALVSDRHSSTLQTQIKTPTEMREEIWTLGLCCWQTSVCLVGRCYNW